MAQKTKVKELVGRGLNSYHTKALQQINRIEKKNKEQNHKISILSNELDNDYLTKTEEGSVISLEHSKEGMVYLDELQGNTLVNYCTDGSKEITLNGDIDVEGTFVTTTEGVDNGKVDVMCEGNTLVNLLSHYHSVSSLWGTDEKKFTVDIVSGSGQPMILGKFTQPLKRGAKYTVIVNISSYSHGYPHFCFMNPENNRPTTQEITPTSVGLKKLVFTTDANMDSYYFRILTRNGVDNKYSIDRDIVILEGDWTNREVPSYFTGMKSVGQDDVSGHKIEILSQNKNLLPLSHVPTDSEGYANRQRSNWDNVKLKPNTKYTLSYTGKATNFTNDYMWGIWIREQKTGKAITDNHIIKSEVTDISLSFTTTNEEYYKIQLVPNNGDTTGSYLFKPNTVILEEGEKTSYVPYALNKKEILINEPLRGLPNGVKDRFVKIGGKWFIERNVGCKDLVVTGGTNWGTQVAEGMIGFYGILDMGTNYNGTAIFEVAENIVCDKLPSIGRNQLSETTYDAIIRGNSYVGITVKADKLETQDLDGFKKYINSLNAKFIYNLATPEYEPLEIESTLNTYNDVTHISNNSIIPCNMKIQNSGYNAIIKPSTLYTVALDTSKSGTVGMNLGGVKGTTTNNVLKLTTPATLADDSLRLYGKGIKGSKVRLLEGDKTNWIPSHFEGMKSSFEDKFDATDNTYKMEILMNNENLLDLSQHSIGTPYTHQYKIENNTITGTYVGDNYTDFQLWFKLKRNKAYKLSWDAESSYILNGNNSQILKGKLNGYNGDNVLHSSYDTNRGIISNVPCDGWYTLHFHSMKNNQFIKNLQLKEVAYSTDFVERKYNKIQFSSIEPLRKWDKFVFKNGQLMIERGSKVFVLDGNTNGIGYTRGFDGAKDTDTNMLFSMRASKEVLPIAGKDGGCSSGICNILPNIYTVDVSTKDVPIGFSLRPYHSQNNYYINIRMNKNRMISNDINGIKDWLNKNNLIVEFPIIEPTYEEIPFELQKIILEGYENGTLFFDTNIPPTSTVTYAGETPIVKSVRLNKTEVLNNTEDINDNIIPYLCDMDYRIVLLQLTTGNTQNVSMARLLGGAYEMIKRDILSKRLTREEYGYRLADYYNAGKLTEEQVRELEELR